MKTTRRKFSAPFKAKVAIEAIKEQSSLQELAAKFELDPTQISSWKREFLKNADLAFGFKSEKENSDSETAPLYS
ncbi:MAG: transposase [Bacteroidota bacterium]